VTGPIVFQHIPKTAGVCVRSVMACNFHLSEILHVPDRRWRDAAFALRAVKRYRFIHGHLHGEFIKAVARFAQVVTFLREPVERVLSLYFFLRSQDPRAHSDRKARFTIEEAHSLSLERFVAHSHPVIASMVGNYQVQMLLEASQADQPARTWVASALANLDRYRFVGVADADLMHASILLLSRTCGWPETGDTPRVNHTARPVAPEELMLARKIIASRNELDIALYNKVRADLEARAARCHGKASARERSAVLAERKHYSTGLNGFVSMGQPLRCWGWHDREVDGEAKRCWRCAAQLRAGVELKVGRGRGDLTLLFHLRSAHPRISVPDTAVEVDGQVLPSSVLQAANRWVVAAVVSRRAIARDGILRLEIVCKESSLPAALVPADSRFVTLALESIEILDQDSPQPHLVELLRQAVCEPRVRPRQLQDVRRALEQEREARQSECAAAELHHRAMLDRAERAETYCKSLKAELDKRNEEHQALLATCEQQRKQTADCAVELRQRADRAEIYCQSLKAELENRYDEHRVLLAARELQQTEAIDYAAALLQRAERAETYCESLNAELHKRQDAYQALAAVRDREKAEAVQAQEALTDRAMTAETYNKALSAELREQQQRTDSLLKTAAPSGAEPEPSEQAASNAIEPT
jgi:hypothetical protein